jgi:hypothetical protein
VILASGYIALAVPARTIRRLAAHLGWIYATEPVEKAVCPRCQTPK